MTIYDKPTKTLMREWAEANLAPGQEFSKSQPVAWFKQHYPDIKSNTVEMHVEGMSVNNRNRRHHSNVHANSGHDLFWKIGPGQFRLWDKERDPKPRYKADIEREEDAAPPVTDDEAEEEIAAAADAAFAYEKDLQNYLARNLHVLEPGLRLYEDEGFDGVEFNAGGRKIDILAVDSADAFVVIELKVSKGYDRVIGQLLRYMNWVEQNLPTEREVRGIIVANEISEDLVLATHKLSAVRLFEYEISFAVSEVKRDGRQAP
jgi:RecB family endonuclease NucS